MQLLRTETVRRAYWAALPLPLRLTRSKPITKSLSAQPSLRYSMGYMNSATTRTLTSTSSDNTFQIGEVIGAVLRGGELIELVGDLGAGKTQLTRGIVAGAGSEDEVQSPTFTLMREYKGKRVTIHHYDFYRLHEAGVMSEELQESLEDELVAVVIEWSDVIADVLPKQRTRVEITSTAEEERTLKVSSTSRELVDVLSNL